MLAQSYASMTAATNALKGVGFENVRPNIMGAAGWRRGSAYAWVEHEWCRKHCKMRFFVYAKG